jgi:geranylgeranyl pyrophosphate synthase
MASKESEASPSETKLALQVKALLWQKGQKALEIAKKSVMEEKIPSARLQAAMEYFMSSWQDVMHPALLALTCEAVGGSPELTTHVGAAMILMAGGADIHDDIIDESTFKYDKETLLGKFGKDLAILTGDAFIIKGFYALNKACEVLPRKQRNLVYQSIKRGFFGISSAEEKESSLKNACSIETEKYLEMIKMKAAVTEETARIGAILGGGSPAKVEALAGFGKAFGVLMTLKDEFIDIFEVDEMKNRAQKEWLPLPILYSLKNPKKAKELKQILKEGMVTEEKLERIVDLVLDSAEVAELKEAMRVMIDEQIPRLNSIRMNRDKFLMMLECAVEDL